jgi:hypothetical protein
MAPYLGYCREPCRRFLMWVQRKRMVRPARKDLTGFLTSNADPFNFNLPCFKQTGSHR